MAVKKIKEKSHSQIENEKLPVKVISETELPRTTAIVKIDKMDMPLATVAEAKQMWKQYQDLMNALMKESDVVIIQGHKKVKKSGVNKIARFFGYSSEVIDTKKEETTDLQGRKNFVWYAWVKVIAPNGRFRVDGAACSSTERNFAHIYHDVLATAITRASNRAIQALAGMGEIEVMEEDEENNPQIPTEYTKPPEKAVKPVAKEPEGWTKPVKTAPKATQAPLTPQMEETIEYQPYEVGDVKYYRKIVNGKVFQEGLDANEWKPMFKTRWGRPQANWKMPISEKQVEFIATALIKAKVIKSVDDPDFGLVDVFFKLNNRLDNEPRVKELKEFDRGDASDVIDTIKEFGKDGLLNLLNK